MKNIRCVNWALTRFLHGSQNTASNVWSVSIRYFLFNIVLSKCWCSSEHLYGKFSTKNINQTMLLYLGSQSHVRQNSWVTFSRSSKSQPPSPIWKTPVVWSWLVSSTLDVKSLLPPAQVGNQLPTLCSFLSLAKPKQAIFWASALDVNLGALAMKDCASGEKGSSE